MGLIKTDTAYRGNNDENDVSLCCFLGDKVDYANWTIGFRCLEGWRPTKDLK